MDCEVVFRGETNDEILEEAERHAESAHQLSATPNLRERLRGLIHDESSEEHKRSTQDEQPYEAEVSGL